MRALAAFLAIVCSSCGSPHAHPSTPKGVTLAKMTVTSRAFSSNGAIPVDFTCDGADRSPSLSWSAPPQATEAFALLADDPDASGGDFTHWVAFNIAKDARSLPEGADPATLGGAVGINGFNRPGYSGPCPPRQEMHRYYFRVFALNARIDAPPGATRDAVEAAMSGHVLAEGSVMGTFAH